MPEGISLAGLISLLGLDSTRVAIEVNRRVIRKADWPGLVLSQGDQIELVHFVGGG